MAKSNQKVRSHKAYISHNPHRPLPQPHTQISPPRQTQCLRSPHQTTKVMASRTSPPPDQMPCKYWVTMSHCSVITFWVSRLNEVSDTKEVHTLLQELYTHTILFSHHYNYAGTDGLRGVGYG